MGFLFHRGVLPASGSSFNLVSLSEIARFTYKAFDMEVAEDGGFSDDVGCTKGIKSEQVDSTAAQLDSGR